MSIEFIMRSDFILASLQLLNYASIALFLLLLIIHFRRKEDIALPEGFTKHISTSYPRAANTFRLSEEVNLPNDSLDYDYSLIDSSFERRVNKSLLEEQVNIVLDKEIKGQSLAFARKFNKPKSINLNYSHAFHKQKGNKGCYFINELVVEEPIFVLMLSEVTVRKIDIKAGEGMKILISNCWVGSITSFASPEQSPSIKISNSFIGSFRMDKGSYNDITFKDSAIVSLHYTEDRKENPIKGRVSIKGSDIFNDSSAPRRIRDIANLRIYFESIGQKGISRYLLGKEKRVERSNLYGLTKLLDLLYDKTSRYGAEPERLTKYFLLNLLFSLLLSTTLADFIVAKDSLEIVEQIPVGLEKLVTGVYFTLQNAFSPLSTLLGNGSLQLTSFTARLVFALSGILGYVMVFIYILRVKQYYENN